MNNEVINSITAVCEQQNDSQRTVIDESGALYGSAGLESESKPEDNPVFTTKENMQDTEAIETKPQELIVDDAPVQKHTRATGYAALTANKFVVDGVSYPGDVVVGWAERHTPIRWCEFKDVDTQQVGYLPCKPALKTSKEIPGVVAIKRKNGKLIILCGTITTERFKAHVFNENQLIKDGPLKEAIRLASMWDNGGLELQKAAADAAAVLNLKPKMK